MVKDNQELHVVNLQELKCTCYKFQIDEFPCAHALAVTKDKKIDLYLYYSAYYTNKALRAVYTPVIYPIPTVQAIPIPNEVKEDIILEPLGRSKPGRRKRRRIKAASK